MDNNKIYFSICGVAIGALILFLFLPVLGTDYDDWWPVFAAVDCMAVVVGMMDKMGP